MLFRSGDQGVGAPGQGIGYQKFQLSGFVAAAGQPEQIVALHIDGRPVECGEAVFEGNRDQVRQQTVLYALEGIVFRMDELS